MTGASLASEVFVEELGAAAMDLTNFADKEKVSADSNKGAVRVEEPTEQREEHREQHKQRTTHAVSGGISPLPARN